MGGEPDGRTRFADRVEAVRQQWAERREVRRLTSTHDFDSQLQLLGKLYRWTEEALLDVNAVYKETIAVLSAGPPTAEVAVFTVSVGDSDPLLFSLEQRRSGAAAWTVEVASVSRRSGGKTPIGAARGAGPWSRFRLEQLLLAQLGAHERGLG
jgi:hypothetical protein